ncbi:hypothetical protein evm_008616 [Chilo suppressalis]|nr:hypothetical protein evm_008616 [Chilo suppressalis]
MPPRCFLGCSSDPGVHLHVFPHPERFPDQFKKWVEIVYGQLNTPEDYAFFRKKRLCDRHFTAKDRNRNNRLNALAVPSLFIKVVSTNCSATMSETQTNTLVDEPLLQTISLAESRDEHGDNTMVNETPVNEGMDIDTPLLQTMSLLGSLRDDPTDNLTPTNKAPETRSVIDVMTLPLQTTHFVSLCDEPVPQLVSTAQGSDSQTVAEITEDILPVQRTFDKSLRGLNTSIFLEHNYSKISHTNIMWLASTYSTENQF